MAVGFGAQSSERRQPDPRKIPTQGTDVKLSSTVSARGQIIPSKRENSSRLTPGSEAQAIHLARQSLRPGRKTTANVPCPKPPRGQSKRTFPPYKCSGTFLVRIYASPPNRDFSAMGTQSA